MSDRPPVDPAAMEHEPVLLEASLEWLRPLPGRWIVDGTFGAGGHSRALLEAGASVVGIDQDPLAAEFAADLPAERFRLVTGNFRHLDRLARDAGVPEIHGVLLDLGVSSMQLDRGERGFAFRQPGPLDMRMGDTGDSAADVVNDLEEEELAAILYRYGEERHSRRLARAIVERRQREPFTRTEQLVETVQRAYPRGRRRDHPARRTFQALRIYVNDELGALEEGLAAAERALAPGGRLVVLSYHSLEDRIVKHFLKGSDGLEPLTKRPQTATDDEIRRNPRARSAKLRAAERRGDR